MSKAFTPPDTLSKADIKAVADVRRSVWTAGFRGLAWGLMGGGFACFFLRKAPLRSLGMGFLERYNTANHAALILMGSGATVSFTSALAAGKNARYMMADVYKRNAHKVNPNLTEYQKKQLIAQKSPEEQMVEVMEQTHRDRMDRMENGSNSGERW